MPIKSAAGALVVFQFVRELTRPWEEMSAYKLGIIDDDGNVLKKTKDLKTSEERGAYTLFHRLIWNVKRMLEKLPGGASKIKSYAAAAWLLKEHKDDIYQELFCVLDPTEITEAKLIIEECAGPVNVTAGVAKGDKPLSKKKKKKKKESDMDEKEIGQSLLKLRRRVLEGKELKRVVRGGKVQKKVQCGAGQIFKNGRCVTATSKDKQRFIKAAKKRKRSLAGKSTSQATRKRAISNRKRKGAGL